MSDVECIYLVRQCWFLEATFRTNFTSEIISSAAVTSISHINKEIFSKDYSSLLTDAKNTPTLRHVLAVAIDPDGSSGIMHWTECC